MFKLKQTRLEAQITSLTYNLVDQLLSLHFQQKAIPRDQQNFERVQVFLFIDLI